MNRIPHSFSALPAPQGQSGVVLIIALVMLLILTMVGIAGLQDTQLQERMAGGAQDRELALQAAESALREAEAAIKNDTAASDDVGLNYKNYEASDTTADVDDIADLQRTDSGGNSVTEAAYWRDHYDWTGSNSSVAVVGLNGLTAQPRYVIERLPNNYSAVPGSWNVTNSTVADTPRITDYIITARGTGATADAVVILQTHYRDIFLY